MRVIPYILTKQLKSGAETINGTIIMNKSRLLRRANRLLVHAKYLNEQLEKQQLEKWNRVSRKFDNFLPSQILWRHKLLNRVGTITDTAQRLFLQAESLNS